MFSFKLHHLQIKGKHYLLLPKLNPRQMKLLAGRFERKGFSVHLASLLSAKTGRSSIWVAPSGFAWSATDPEDALVPIIPELLTCSKEAIPLGRLEDLYFSPGWSAKAHSMRLTTRIESDGLWYSLRAAGDCGLTPDERSVALTLLSGVEKCRLVADFVGEEPASVICGRKRYFETTLDIHEVESTLRSAGEQASRNSYLPRDGVLDSGRIGPTKLRDALNGLGDWCFFVPRAARKL